MPVVLTFPHHLAGGGLDEPGADEQETRQLLHPSLQQVGHSQRPPDLGAFGPLSRIGQRRAMGDHEQPWLVSQLDRQGFRHAVGQERLVGIVVDILERQHGQGRYFGQRRANAFADGRRPGLSHGPLGIPFHQHPGAAHQRHHDDHHRDGGQFLPILEEGHGVPGRFRVSEKNRGCSLQYIPVWLRPITEIFPPFSVPVKN